jgi:hypothetical protein
LAALAATAGPGEGAAAALSAAAAAAAMACGSNGSSRGQSVAAGVVPDFVQVLQLAQQQLCQQQVEREGLQAKLNEARAAVERKNTLIRWAQSVVGVARTCRFWRGRFLQLILEWVTWGLLAAD